MLQKNNKGWFRESKRHGLAAKGIKTAQKKRISTNVSQKAWLNADFDRDGVKNKNDCRPLDPTKQDVEFNKTIKEDFNYIPFYISDKSMKDIYSGKASVYHINSKLAKRFAPKARQQALTIIKEHPHLIGEMNKNKVEDIIYSSKRAKPGEDIITGEIASSKKEKKSLTTGTVEPVEMGRFSTPLGRHKGEVFVRSYKSPSEWKRGEIGKISRTEGAENIFHELKHVEQFNKVGGRRKIDKEIEKYKYEDRPHEIEAKKYAHDKIVERWDYPEYREGDDVGLDNILGPGKKRKKGGVRGMA